MATSNKNSKALLTQIDEFFYSKKSSEVSMFYFVIALVIGYVVYQFVYLETDKNFTIMQRKIFQIRQKVNSEKNYLMQNTPQKLAAMKQSVAKKHKDLDNIIYKISYVDNTLTELSYLLFDDRSWAKFVDNIADLAKKNHIEIKEIGNKFYNPTYQKITHVVEVSVKSKAKFTDLMKFINEIEESPLVIDINELNMTKPDNKILSHFKIAVWGMKY